MQSGALRFRTVIFFLTLICVSASLYSAFFYRRDRRITAHAPVSVDTTLNVDTTPNVDAVVDVDTSVSFGQNVPQDWEWITGHNLTYPLRYSSRAISTRKVPGLRRAALTKIEAPLFEDFHTVESDLDVKVGLTRVLELEVPASKGSVQASHLIFGIQTTIKRLEDSVPQLARWIANTGAKLYVVLLEAEGVAVNTEQLVGLETRMRSQGFDVTLFPAHEEDTFPQRYFSLVNIMYQHRTPLTQWVSLIDDDTFFPSMHALLAMLDKHDSGEQHYIGSLSEDWWAVQTYGFMGFGGAGVFLSLPLAEVIDAHTDVCKNNLRSSAGDITVMDCIYTHTPTKLTPVPDLHQADMHGDLSGFYESGRHHLSLHHWKEGSVFGKGLPMADMHLVSDICGECFLQRWQFGNDMLLTNAFSVTTYPKGHLKTGDPNEVNMDKLEETWNSNMNMRHSLGPTRSRLLLEVEKIQYSFLNATICNTGVRQLYFHKGVDGDIDTLLELVWQEAGPE
ncbi:hypothetical protein MMC26_004487 [Xylographa opegraphella]|nr:hypothetical protein [Xylographa opegraphella]